MVPTCHCYRQISQASFSVSAFDDDNFAEVKLDDGVTDGVHGGGWHCKDDQVRLMAKNGKLEHIARLYY